MLAAAVASLASEDMSSCACAAVASDLCKLCPRAALNLCRFYLCAALLYDLHTCAQLVHDLHTLHTLRTTCARDAPREYARARAARLPRVDRSFRRGPPRTAPSP